MINNVIIKKNCTFREIRIHLETGDQPNNMKKK
jgi:hypothetical protein